MALLSLQNLEKAFGGPLLLDAATLQIERNERICLLGRNGEGKSTLLKIVEGVLEPDQGQIIRQPGLKVRRLSQEVPADLDCRVGELALQEIGEMLDESQRQQAAEKAISLVGLESNALYAELSGGQKRRALLARAIACEPDILLLDEPTNHLDLEAIQWMESFLIRYSGTLLFVTHDRAFLRRLATRIVELDRGHLHSWACDYDTYLKRKQALLEGEAEQWAQFDKKLAQEEIWIRKGIKARRTRNEGRVRELEKMRALRRQRRERPGAVNMRVSEAGVSGRKVITAKNISFDYEGEALIRDFSTTILRGDKIGIIGANGCGKSTLVRLLLKELQPASGEVLHGTKLEIAYFDQHRAALDESKTLAENLCAGDTLTIGGVQKNVLGYLQDFLFTPDRARQKVAVLSGGERNRLLLAKLFAKPSNFLVLDEPTNDLDIETLELLEERLLAYEGTVLLVSHDRDFLNHVVTSTLVFEKDGRVNAYPGGYDDWLEQRQEARVVTAKTTQEKAVKKRVTRKLSNKEREELARLPKEIEALEEELETLQQAMTSPDFYRQPPEKIAELTARAEKIPKKMEKAFDRWEKLETLST